jgi:hypothetical protein
MIVLPRTVFCQPSVQICNGTAVVFATLLNLTDPVFIRDPSMQHDGGVTNRQKGLNGYMPGAPFLDDLEDVPYFLLQKASVGYNEIKKCKRKYGTGLY